MLGRIFAACMQHGYIPDEMLRGVIKPELKGNLCKTKAVNYRPVMKSSMFLKTFEYCLYPVFKNYINIDPSQFGFQEGSSCDFAITILKETVLAYKKQNTNVYGAAFDLSKAYDKINHYKLIEMMIRDKFSPKLIKILEYMVRNTFVSTCYGGIQSHKWKALNGVRQGGILSSMIFTYYINGVIKEIKKMNSGCYLKSEKTSIIAFADDIFLLSPSVKGLQMLVNRAAELLTELCLSINVKKSNYICFKHKKWAENRQILYLLGESMKKVATI